MKKMRFAFLLIALCPLMSAFQDKEHSVISINSIEDRYPFAEVNITQLVNILESKQDFVLETYSPTCEACINLEPILKKYCTNQNKIVYRFNIRNITEDIYISQLQEPYPDIFASEYVPTITFIHDGKLTYDVNPNKFGSYNGLKSIMNKHFTSSKIMMANDYYSFELYRNKNDNYIAYFYDYNNASSLKYASQYLINEDVAKNKTPVLLINSTAISETMYDVKQYFNTDSDTFACLVKNNEIIKTIDYSLGDGSSISDLVASF